MPIKIMDEARRKFLALPPTPYFGEPVCVFCDEVFCGDEESLREYLVGFFAGKPDREAPLFIGTERVTLSMPDLMEEWQNMLEVGDDFDKHHVPQAVWDAAEALENAIEDAQVDYWVGDDSIRVVLPEALIEECRQKARANHAD